MLDELRTWWQNLTPQVQQLLQDGSLVLAALLGGHFLGVMVTRALRSRNFDAALRVPGGSPPEGEADRGITPTLIAGILVRMTIWTACAWWLARQHEQVELASSLARVINRTWALATVLVAALAIGSLLATRLIDALQGFTKAGAEATPAKNGAAVSQKHVAGAVGAAVYGLVVLLTLLIAADVFEWPLTRTSATALWQLAHHLLIAGAALLVGGLGARWARDLVVAEGTVTPEKRAAQYTALGIVAATTVLAVAVLLSSAGVLIGLAAVAVLGFLLWLVSGYLPDVTAGLQLRAQQVREVWIDKEMWQVTEIGFLATQVTRSGEFCRLQNRVVLEARLHGAPSEGSVR